MTKEDMRNELDLIIPDLERVIAIVPQILRPVGRLRVVRSEMHNRRPVTKGKHTSEPFTDEQREKIRTDHTENPDLPQHDLAKMNNTNQGRISNTLAGVRT